MQMSLPRHSIVRTKRVPRQLAPALASPCGFVVCSQLLNGVQCFDFITVGISEPLPVHFCRELLTTLSLDCVLRHLHEALPFSKAAPTSKEEALEPRLPE